jgi:hypothetical protein
MKQELRSSQAIGHELTKGGKVEYIAGGKNRHADHKPFLPRKGKPCPRVPAGEPTPVGVGSDVRGYQAGARADSGMPADLVIRGGSRGAAAAVLLCPSFVMLVPKLIQIEPAYNQQLKV